MSGVGERERITQNRVVKLFQEKLGYTYLGNWQDRENNSGIEVDILRNHLSNKRYNHELLTRAMEQLTTVAGNQVDRLYYVNKDLYTLLRYGAQVKEQAGDKKETISFINWESPADNEFSFAEEVTIRGEYDKRPDLVLYVNGIAL